MSNRLDTDLELRYVSTGLCPNCLQCLSADNNNRESSALFENRIKPQVYVRCITHSTIYDKTAYC